LWVGGPIWLKFSKFDPLARMCTPTQLRGPSPRVWPTFPQSGAEGTVGSGQWVWRSGVTSSPSPSMHRPSAPNLQPEQEPSLPRITDIRGGLSPAPGRGHSLHSGHGSSRQAPRLQAGTEEQERRERGGGNISAGGFASGPHQRLFSATETLLHILGLMR
jgi:hypothetical protein